MVSVLSTGALLGMERVKQVSEDEKVAHPMVVAKECIGLMKRLQGTTVKIGETSEGQFAIIIDEAEQLFQGATQQELDDCDAQLLELAGKCIRLKRALLKTGIKITEDSGKYSILIDDAEQFFAHSQEDSRRETNAYHPVWGPPGTGKTRLSDDLDRLADDLDRIYDVPLQNFTRRVSDDVDSSSFVEP